MRASTAASVTETLERATLRKVYLRLVPFCFLLYILCYIDRINVSFAALTMNKELGLSGYIYGLAAGAFFWGYCLLEVPSNLIMERVGARIWLTRIMVSWACCRPRLPSSSAHGASLSFASCSASPRPDCFLASCCTSIAGSRSTIVPAW